MKNKMKTIVEILCVIIIGCFVFAFAKDGYNTFSYYMHTKAQDNRVKELFSKMNSGEYSPEEIDKINQENLKIGLEIDKKHSKFKYKLDEEIKEKYRKRQP